MYEDYDKILLLHLSGKKWKKYFPSIVFNLISLNEGCKPSFLWDIGPPVDVKVLIGLIEDLKNESLLKSAISLLNFESEIFLVNLETCYGHLNKYSSCIKFINCSWTIDKPTVIEADCEIYKFLSDILRLIKESVSLLLQHTEEKHDNPNELINLNIVRNHKYFCPVTIFGILLGYPVVYWSKNIFKGNCLSLIPLTVCKVRVILPGFVKTNACNILYSFSVPASLNLDSFIDCWILSLDMLADVEFKLLKEIVTLPCIQL